MKMKEKKQILRSGFTLLEVVTTLSVFALVMGGVFMAIYKIYGFVLFSKSEVLAINYAKSGMEGVMQIRDTNWRRYSSSRDEHWIRTNPFNHSSPLMQSGLYILLETGVKLPQPSPNPPLFNKFFLLSGASLGVEHWNYANFLALKPEERVEFLLTGDQ